MEWNVLTLLLSAAFVLLENGLYLLMRLTKRRALSVTAAVLLLAAYMGMLIFGLMHGITKQQGLLLLLLTLPGAFLPAERRRHDGI
ncbi:MAG: hypothetical protein MJ192_10985 [Clostridia bacterium]|nr:hypothetical protein [Clostridia bacterium]